MPQSLANVILHLVYSTKHRLPLLKDEQLRAELYAYMATVLKALDCPCIIVGGVDDHIHIACYLSRKVSIAELVEETKTATSKWIKGKGSRYKEFYWQAGYGAFSISPSKSADLRRYIENQAEHHRTMSFQDEFRRFCQLHGLPLDERYAWD